MPNGKAIQGPDFHFDGQNFSKAFDINFLDKEGKKDYVWQNTWAITTRMIGVLIALHGDDKGLVLPPSLAPIQVAIVPILFDKTKDQVLKEAQRIKQSLEKKHIKVHLDDRENYSPGWKFNEWEMKGIPLRIEIGPKDLEKKQVLLARRDTGEKQALKISSLTKELPSILEKIQTNLYNTAEKVLKNSIVEVDNLKEAKTQLKNKKILFAPWCGSVKCEEQFKTDTGAKSLNSPDKQPKLKPNQKCFICEEKATKWFYLGKSY